ncbi:MAG TPA: 2'-5' RNA ligase family protein [Gemmatimonadaceae bacterium]|jgi:2'-5' RNA ligase|nr:2'-5' RNA ligase family protein [Gemmatimonadaceae bacterium]
MARGIFMVAELTGEAREQVLDVQRWADPKLASASPPHITLVGSSGVGPIAWDTDVDDVASAIAPIAASTPPITVRFGAPVRFMQTEIVVLPLDPHGPLRTLHERIATSGLRFERARFVFSPHCTLSFFPVITPEMQRRLMRVRVNVPVVIDSLQFYLTPDIGTGRKVLELALTGGALPVER